MRRLIEERRENLVEIRVQAEKESRHNLMRMPTGKAIQNQPKKKIKIKIKFGATKSQLAASADYYLSIVFCILSHSNCYFKY